MQFKFHEGESVRLKADHPVLGLKAGDTGRVWALYAAESPSYEVTFHPAEGDTFDVTLSEEELLSANSSPASFGISAKQVKEAA